MKSFEEAYNEARGAGGDLSLLLGNGFSIACDRTFDYRRLLDQAAFGPVRQRRRIRAVFENLGTADFEQIVRRLEESAETLDLYMSGTATTGRMRKDARRVRRAFAEALSRIHPDRIGEVGDDRLDACHDFLTNFAELFTLNYDLLLYWAILRKGGAHFNDGFGRSGSRLVHLNADQQTVSWVHGAVHLHQELVPGAEPCVYKNEWQRSTPLVDTLRADLHADRFPLIVMEGVSEQKQGKIDGSPYLTNALRKLRDLKGALFTYGWALGTNDEHVVRAIARSGVDRLCVGIFGDERRGTNPDTIGAATRLRAKSGNRVSVSLWDATTADVW